MHAVKSIFIKYQNTVTKSKAYVKGRRLLISNTVQITFKECFDNYVNTLNRVIRYKIKQKVDETKVSQ